MNAHTATFQRLVKNRKSGSDYVFHSFRKGVATQLETDSVAASHKDLAILKISEVPDGLWHMALADGVAATLAPGADEWIAKLQGEYQDRGIVTITREEISALMEGKVEGRCGWTPAPA